MVNSITEYISYFEAGEDMTNEEYGIYMRAIHNFAYKDIEPDYTTLPPLVKAALRTVIASVRKNKEDRINGSKGGRPKAEEEKPGFLEENNPPFYNSETNVNVNDNVKDNVNTQIEPEETKNFGKLQQDVYALVCDHNKSAKKERKIPISGNFWTFTCKEMRELISQVGVKEPPERIKAAVLNFLKVANSDTWQKSFTWRTFCNHYVDFTPDYFTITRYLNPEKETDDATKKPENIFYFANKDNPDFHVDTFQAHINDWKEAGRPQGKEYLKLQTAWEMGGQNAD